MRGLIGIIHLVLVILAISDIMKGKKTGGNKILWILITLFVPVIGPILYFVIGKK